MPEILIRNVQDPACDVCGGWGTVLGQSRNGGTLIRVSCKPCKRRRKLERKAAKNG